MQAREISRPRDEHPDGSRCSVKGCSKPAKLDDLCKRHAYAKGLMPHGKIGEG